MSFKAKKFLILLNLSLLTISCKSDKILYRTTSDYFPLKTGMAWEYSNGNDTTMVEVIGDTFVLGHYCILVYRNYLEEFWIKDKTEIKRLVEKKLNRAGYDYILEQQFRRYFQIPLIKGNSWYEDYNNRILVLGDTINIRHTITGKVNGWEDITTPAGNFTEVYNITLIDSIKLNDSLLVATNYFWLAPEIGIVRYANPDTFELIQFSSKNP